MKRQTIQSTNTTLITDATYTHLRSVIRGELESTALRIQKVYQTELISSYWNIGRVLSETIGFDPTPSARNGAIIQRLARDFKRPDTFFYSLVKFYRFYPSPPVTGLSWTHYLQLLSISNDKKRARLEAKALREGINCKDFRVHTQLPVVGDLLSLPPSQSSRLFGYKIPVVRGELYHYKVLNHESYRLDEDRMLVDAGFSIEREVKTPMEGDIHSGLIVRSLKEGEDYRVRIAQFEKDRLYTYRAFVTKVSDGDTLTARIDVGFRMWVTERLRLRLIDTPEITSTAGQSAQLRVKKILERCPCIVIKTYKEEKYGRFLADVFYKEKEEDAQVVLKEGMYLNQQLLIEGLAKPYTGGVK